jgi:hypothetical protein
MNPIFYRKSFRFWENAMSNEMKWPNRLTPMPSLSPQHSVIRPSDAARWEHLLLDYAASA